MSPDGVEHATHKGLAFIQREQAKDGGFASLSSSSQTLLTATKTYQTTFTPALILTALSKLDYPAANQIRKKLAAWLLAQKSPGWSFNYWATTAPERDTLPYPDDLDDTACALIALKQHDPALVDEACLGKLVKLLITTESAVGGPYRTWLVAPDAPAAWQDVDLAVNSNINYLLSLVAEPLPNVTQLIEGSIQSQRFTSPYYPSAYPIIYYIARWYRGKYRSKLADYIVKQQKNNWWGTPLHTALAVSSLIQLGERQHCEPAIQLLLKRQRPNGSWPAAAFCLDPMVAGQTYYSGSAALTTALVLEAIQAYQQTTPVAAPLHAQAIQTTTQSLRQQIADTARTICDAQSPALRRQSRLVLRQTLHHDQANHDEIVLLPYLFNQCLVNPLAKSQKDTFVHLGLANVLGWMAYTIYDDFLDDEGQPSQLSVANMALRHSLDQFAKALPKDDMYKMRVQAVFDVIDGANAWELAHCRMTVTKGTISLKSLPRYPSSLQLADRSLGHTLTPLGVLAAAGVSPHSQGAAAVQQALRHYIAARQLNDDLHDWEQDLRAGRISFVVAKLMNDINLAPGSYRLNRLVPKMQRQFWHHTLPNVCKIISRHTLQARQAAQASQLLAEHNIITNITAKIDESVKHTLSEQTKAQKFLAAYQSS